MSHEWAHICMRPGGPSSRADSAAELAALYHAVRLEAFGLYPRFSLCSFYLQGNLFDFLRLTGWRGSKVLYFGDHLYSDLAVSEKVSALQ